MTADRKLNPIEKVMIARSTTFKLTVAVALLVVVLWLSGSPIQSLWMTPVIILTVWIGIQVALWSRGRHHHA